MLSAVSPVIQIVRRLRSKAMVRNTGSMLVNQLGRVALQGAYFVIISRTLGVAGFGAFAATVALVALLAPFGSLGAINLMIRHIAKDPSRASGQYATAIAVTAGSGVCLAVLLTGLSQWVAPSSIAWWTVLCIAGGDLLGARLIEVAGAVHLARERMFRTAMFPLILHAARLVAAVVLLASPLRPTPGVLAVLYLVASLLVTVPILARTRAYVGPARPDLAAYRAEWRDGLLFAFSLSAQSVYNDIDKVMLGRLGTLEAVGVYAAAYRIVDMAFTPMRALLAASYARFFREGALGLRSTLRFTRQIAKPGLAYCIFVSFALFVLASLVPLVLGAEYEESVDALRGLAILPLLKGIHYLAADSLTGAGMQGTRTVFQVIVAGLNVGLNLWLIPKYSWRGAVAASLISDGLLALTLWCVVLKRTRSRT